MAGISKNVGWEIIKRSFFPFIIFISLTLGYIHFKLKIVPAISEGLCRDLKKYIATIFIISVSFIIQKIFGAILGWYKENIAARTLTKLDDKLASIVRRTFKVVIWVIAILLILPLYGVSISALIATLGVGSLAIALAAQDTIANIIAGFMIMVDSPFRVGDKIKLPSGEVVRVLDIGVRRTELLSEDKAIIIMPNLDLSKSKIVNYTYGEERMR